MIGVLVMIGVVAVTWGLVLWAAVTAPLLPPWEQEQEGMEDE
jgi:hypothetical protein